DGGYTYPTVVLANTPNDASADIIVPNVSSSTARLRVACADNIFFDISDANFTIVLGAGVPSLSVSKIVVPTGSVTVSDTLTYTIDVGNVGTAPASTTTITDTFDAALVNPVCNGVSGDLLDTVAINSSSSVSYSCTAQVDPTLVLEIEHTAVPTEILSGEEVTYTITITNSHSSLSLSNVLVDAPSVSGCTPALSTPQTLGSGASQTYTCPNNIVNYPTISTATVTGELTISNVANASDPDDSGGPKSSSTVENMVIISANDIITVILSDYTYIHLPIVTR
ncbi:MAG: hypothetical protein GY805_30405, partial [Chloroflexi bacterium]|nr:hypothetical protein [Chloroflexota bacterium]